MSRRVKGRSAWSHSASVRRLGTNAKTRHTASCVAGARKSKTRRRRSVRRSTRRRPRNGEDRLAPRLEAVAGGKSDIGGALGWGFKTIVALRARRASRTPSLSSRSARSGTWRLVVGFPPLAPPIDGTPTASRLMADGLEIIAVGIDHEGGVIVRRIVALRWPLSRPPRHARHGM